MVQLQENQKYQYCNIGQTGLYYCVEVMLMNQLTCAFTGHRPSKFPWKNDESDPRCTALRLVLAERIEKLAERGVTGFLCGMAEGTDLWCAEIVLAMRKKNPAMKLHCILPCKEQADKWSASSQERYRSILDRADSVVYVNRDYHKNCMLERNRFMVEYASVLLAVYSGARRSGTGATINYARKLGREIFVIDPITSSVTHEEGRA